MAREIKILESDHLPSFEEKVNNLLEEGWKIKGGLNIGGGVTTVLLQRKLKKRD